MKKTKNTVITCCVLASVMLYGGAQAEQGALQPVYQIVIIEESIHTTTTICAASQRHRHQLGRQLSIGQ